MVIRPIDAVFLYYATVLHTNGLLYISYSRKLLIYYCVLFVFTVGELK